MGPAASTALRLLHAATCRPAVKFEPFLYDVFQRDPSQWVPFDHPALQSLAPSDVLSLIRARQGVPADEPWVLVLGLDEFNQLFDGPPASIDDPGTFMRNIVASLGPWLMGESSPAPGDLPRTTVVTYLAGTMPSVMAKDGPVFRPGGLSLTPLFIPLAPLSPAECAAICEAQPLLRDCWRVLPRFRRLMDALRGWPRPVKSLVEATWQSLSSHGPEHVDWAYVHGQVLSEVARMAARSPVADLALICPAVLAAPVDLADDAPLLSRQDEDVTWAKLVDLGYAMFVPSAKSPDAHHVIVTSLFIETRVCRVSVNLVPAELRGLRRMYEECPPMRSEAPEEDASLSEASFERVVAFFEAVRPELLCGLQWRTPRQDRRVALGVYYSAGRFGRVPRAGFAVDDDGRAALFKLEMMPPAEVQCNLSRETEHFPVSRDPGWDNGRVFRNAAGAPCGDYWRLARCRHPESGHVVEVLIVGQVKLCAARDALSTTDVAVEYDKVDAALKDSGLAERFAGRWVFVLHTTARASVEPSDLPVNAVMIDADALGEHMGPVLSSALRLVIRGRKANANTSSCTELMLVDGVGRPTADAIIAGRGAGGFRDWASLCARVPLARALSEDAFEF